ncbi:MAG: nitrous oxide reductase accessory protein NosL [Pseudomonadota bacterium]
MMLTRRRCLACAGALLLAGCADRKDEAALAPAEFTGATSCALDGMLLADYPGPKAQIHYADAKEPEFLCDTVEMFSLLLRPEQVRKLRAVYTQDMGAADWDQPRGHWFDAKAGFYVVGSKRPGAMGPTIPGFRQQADAQKFAAQWGGKVVAFAEVTPQMADLSGGAQQDTRM